MSIYEFEYADMSSKLSTDEWGYDKILWVPMSASDRAYICEQYNDEEFEWDYSKCTQWLVYISGPTDELDDWTISIMPCASDGSSGFDTPFIDIYGVSKYDEVVSELQRGEYYKPNESNCSCKDTTSQFYQDHGSCEWCYFVGDK